MTDHAVRVEHLAKRYAVGRERNAFPTLRESLGRRRRAAPPSTFWALRDVSFDVHQGEVVGILGRNGAGKSTLLKILSRIVEPTSGRVVARGRVSALLEVGTGFHPELTGRENVFLNGAILGMSRRETAARLDEIVAFSGIEPFIDTPVKRYSSGMYLRLGFAVAAHIDPDILIVDEVLGVGDAAFQAKCMARMGELVGEGRTVLMVSHHLAAIQRLCSRAIIVADGVVSRDGAPGPVIAEYLRGFEEGAEQPLAERARRIGRGPARLTGLAVEGALGPSLVAGEPAAFAFRIEGATGPVRCAFSILDALGQDVTSFDTANPAPQDALPDALLDARPDLQPDSAPGGPGRLLRCEIPALPLRPGRYRVDVALSAPDGTIEDLCEGAVLFEVRPGAVGGRETVAEPGYGPVEIPHRWGPG